MNVRSLATLATAAGACLAGVAPAADTTAKKSTKTAPKAAATKAAPVAVPTVGNQQLADEVASRLTASGAAQMADVSVSVSDGVVTLAGTCRDAATKEMVIQQVRTITGVKKVRDGLSAGTGIVQAQAAGPIGLPTSGPVAAPMTLGQIPSGPGLNSGAMIDPVPLGAAGAGAADMSAPNLPPYAWPTYAPHNNVSRVAYPQAYPYNAFPFIGPFYPFPKVPLGWRSVLLQWEDGHWWIGKTAAPQDYWRVRFW